MLSKKSFHWFAILFIAVFVMLPGCKHEPEAIPDPDPDPTGRPCHPDTVYFENDILPLLQSSCALSGCHDVNTQADGVNLTNYNAIIQTADVRPFNPGNSDLYERITDTDLDKIMPPPPRQSLSAEQIQMVYTWIMQGALNNGCDPEGCDSVQVSFSQTIRPIIQGRCFGCHSGPSPSGNISLQSHADLVAVANNGKLLGSITHSTGFVPMPQNSAKLSACQIAQIRKWINDGTPDN